MAESARVPGKTGRAPSQEVAGSLWARTSLHPLRGAKAFRVDHEGLKNLGWNLRGSVVSFLFYVHSIERG